MSNHHTLQHKSKLSIYKFGTHGAAGERLPILRMSRAERRALVQQQQQNDNTTATDGSISVLQPTLFDNLPVPEASEHPGGHMCPKSLWGRPDVVALWDRNQVSQHRARRCHQRAFQGSISLLVGHGEPNH